MMGSLGEAAVMLAGTLIVTGGVLATVVAWNLVVRRRGGSGFAYRRVCRGLGLDGPQRRLVAQVARAAGIDHASSLLISRGCFDVAVRRCMGGRSDRRVAAIRRKVFGAAVNPDLGSENPDLGSERPDLGSERH